jgi:hypothetical protein
MRFTLSREEGKWFSSRDAADLLKQSDRSNDKNVAREIW